MIQRFPKNIRIRRQVLLKMYGLFGWWIWMGLSQRLIIVADTSCKDSITCSYSTSQRWLISEPNRMENCQIILENEIDNKYYVSKGPTYVANVQPG